MALTGSTIASTYLKLLRANSDTMGADATASYIQDSADTDSVLSISTTRVGIGNAAPTALLTAGAITTLVTDGTTAVTPEGVNVHITEASKYAMGIKNADASGDGLLIQAGDASDDFALRVEDYDSANDLLVVQGGGSVGIGTASPSDELEISGTTPKIRITDEADNTYANIYNSLGNLVFEADRGNATASSKIQFTIDGSASLVTIDSSGNVGIGNSSLESWHANDTALQIGSACSIWAKSSGEADGRISISQNAYKDASTGNMQRFLNDQASVYFQDGGRHFFYVAGAAGADADITWTSALTIANNGDTTVNAGDLIMGTAGKGISFANAADTATGETVRSSILDDYEEGYGNFIVKEGTNVIDTGSNNVLVYVRVGKMVYICGYIIIESDATVGTGAVTIAGLPYVMDNATSAGRNWCNFQVTEQGATGFSTTGNYVYGYANYGESFMNLRQSVFDGTEVAGLVGSELAQSMQIRVSGTYIAA